MHLTGTPNGRARVPVEAKEEDVPIRPGEVVEDGVVANLWIGVVDLRTRAIRHSKHPKGHGAPQERGLIVTVCTTTATANTVVDRGGVAQGRDKRPVRLCL